MPRMEKSTGADADWYRRQWLLAATSDCGSLGDGIKRQRNRTRIDAAASNRPEGDSLRHQAAASVWRHSVRLGFVGIGGSRDGQCRQIRRRATQGYILYQSSGFRSGEYAGWTYTLELPGGPSWTPGGSAEPAEPTLTRIGSHARTRLLGDGRCPFSFIESTSALHASCMVNASCSAWESPAACGALFWGPPRQTPVATGLLEPNFFTQ